MSTIPPDAPRPGFPPSPCTRVCTLDADNVCIGCQRTLDEIVAWASMSAEQQWTVVRNLPQRRE
jgi:predicted Fe-S protein YdhL (DUF1289 family)